MSLRATARPPSGRGQKLLGAAGSGILIALAFLAACSETRRSAGEDCLKADDCLSGICSAQRCVAQPPVLEAAPPLPMIDAGPEVGDAPAEGETAPADAQADARETG